MLRVWGANLKATVTPREIILRCYFKTLVRCLKGVNSKLCNCTVPFSDSWSRGSAFFFIQKTSVTQVLLKNPEFRWSKKKLFVELESYSPLSQTLAFGPLIWTNSLRNVCTLFSLYILILSSHMLYLCLLDVMFLWGFTAKIFWA